MRESEVIHIAGRANCGNNIQKYTCPEQMQGLIDAYFDSCDGELLRDADGNPMLDKFQQPIFVGKHPPTTSGLARALGFKSRKTLRDYRGRKAFKDTIDAAMLRIEEYTEQRLFDRDGSNGARFSLQCNFKEWKPDPEEGTSAPTVNIICDIPKTIQESKATQAAEEVKADGGEL